MFRLFAARYSSEAALRGNTRNICHKQTPSRYERKIVESDVKHHSLTPLLVKLSPTITSNVESGVKLHKSYPFFRGLKLVA